MQIATIRTDIQGSIKFKLNSQKVYAYNKNIILHNFVLK